MVVRDRTVAGGERFYFPPDSALWRISRESVLLLGGLRVLLMQIAHPLVAEAVYHHSYVFDQPVKRLLRTLDLTLTPIFGTRDEVLAAARTINSAHRPVKGALEKAVGGYPKGAGYDALRPDLLLWVYMTLVEGSLSGYERFVGPLTHQEKQAFYEDSQGLVELIGVRRADLPDRVDDLLGYMDEMIADGTVVVGPKAREIAPLLLLQSPPILKPFTFLPASLTIGLLPPAVRRQYGFRYSTLEAKALDAFCAGVRRAVPHLPGQVRYVPQYQRALARMRPNL